ncbi:MAG: sel1 repeat family protein [Parachlamydiaceae bacterium]|nr:MAG: sel1 repeat family protein [Parachlamydiaceae bacterium]
MFHEAASSGHPDACFNIGFLHQIKQNPSHYRLAACWYSKSTQNSRTLYHLAQMYFKGLGVFQDRETGLRYLHEAAIHGDTEAQSSFSRKELGKIYYQKAQRLEENLEFEGAFKYFLQAMDFNNPDACHKIGLYYLEGIYAQKI